MKNIVRPRNDDRCALCRIAKANETGSHMVPNLLTAVAFSFDGKYKRDREIVEKYHINDPDSNSVHYGRDVAADKITADLGHEMTDEELDNNVNTLCYDYIFCKDFEKRFGVLETAFGDYYKMGKICIQDWLISSGYQCFGGCQSDIWDSLWTQGTSWTSGGFLTEV